MPNIMVMSNEKVLKLYPHLVSKVEDLNARCTVGLYRTDAPSRRCKNDATLIVDEHDMCASHAKSILNTKINYG